jgi:hypothetical protein
MHTANLEEGLVVLVAGDAATIVRCVPGSKVEITRYKDKKKIIVPVDDITLLPYGANVGKKINLSVDTDDIPLAELKVAEERFELIKKYLQGELSVKQVAALASTSCPRIYQLVKNYDGEIGPHSLLRRKRWLH